MGDAAGEHGPTHLDGGRARRDGVLAPPRRHHDRRRVGGSALPGRVDRGPSVSTPATCSSEAGDPVALAQEVPDRIAHVHLKDVDLDVLDAVRSGELTYTQGVANRLYTVLGQGAIDLPAIVSSLESAGYAGWYVPEHDRTLGSAADGPAAQADAAASVAYLGGL